MRMLTKRILLVGLCLLWALPCWAANSVYVTTVTGVSGTTYITPVGSGTQTTSARTEILMPCAGTITNLRVEVSVAPGEAESGAAWTINFYKEGGSEANPTVTITEIETQGFSDGTLSVNAGDSVALKITETGTCAETNFYICWEFTATIAGQTILASNTAGLTGGTGAIFFGLYGYTGIGGATESNYQFVAPVGGTLKNLYVRHPTAPGADTTRTLTVMQNGNPSTITVSFSDAEAGEKSDTTHTLAISAGDLICIGQTEEGEPANGITKLSLCLELATDGDFILPRSGTDDPSTSTTEYIDPSTYVNWTATEANVKSILPACTLKSLYCDIETAPGDGKSYTFTARKEGAGTDLTKVITGAATTTGNVSADVSYAAYEMFAFESDPDGTPSAPGATKLSVYGTTATGAADDAPQVIIIGPMI